MDYKYNEEEYGKMIYEKGFQSQYLRYELVVLVKYLKHIGKTKKQTIEEVYKFCEDKLIGYNKVKHYKVIDNAIISGRKRKNKLIVIKKIDLYKSEIEYIDNLDIGHEYKKLLLSFLIKKKISQEISRIMNGVANLSIYYGGSKQKYKNVFTCANIIGDYKVNEMINILVNKKIVTSVRNNKGDIILDFVKNIKYPSEVYKEVKNFNDIGYIFDVYKGENKVAICEECGKYIIKRSNKTKYCKECALEIKKHQNKIADKKYRNKTRK